MGFKALLQLANFTLGPDATLNTEIRNNSGPDATLNTEIHKNSVRKIRFLFFYVFCVSKGKHYRFLFDFTLAGVDWLQSPVTIFLLL